MWIRFDIGTSGQQIHIAFGANEPDASRHPCFGIESPDAMIELQKKIWEHHARKDASAPMAADQPGQANSGKCSSWTIHRNSFHLSSSQASGEADMVSMFD